MCNSYTCNGVDVWMFEMNYVTLNPLRANMSTDQYLVTMGAIYRCTKMPCEFINRWKERIAFEYMIRTAFYDNPNILGRSRELAIKHVNMMYNGARYNVADEDEIMALRCMYLKSTSLEASSILR